MIEAGAGAGVGEGVVVGEGVGEGEGVELGDVVAGSAAAVVVGFSDVPPPHAAKARAVNAMIKMGLLD